MFFGYPSQPQMRRETLSKAVGLLSGSHGLEAVSWEDLRIGGKLIIDEVLDAIENCELAVFEVTDLNHNVMFELGYAIARQKKLWLLRDPSEMAAKAIWDEVRLLTTVGYAPYLNSDEILQAFDKDRPWQQERTLYDRTIRPVLEPTELNALLFARSLHETEADRELARRVEDERRAGIRVLEADPKESGVQPLSWYAQQIYASVAVLVHFSSPERHGSAVHNARCALMAGLATGLERRLLMLAEEDYTPPIDYRDLMFVYRTAAEARKKADDWLGRALVGAHAAIAGDKAVRARVSLATELKFLRLGDHVAENEAPELDDYFIETASYQEVLLPKTAIFPGRKGSGKSANLMQAASALASDKRNLVCVVKPPGYELHGILSLLRAHDERHEKTYLTDALWRFLLMSEVARGAYEEVLPIPLGARSAEVTEFITYVESEAPYVMDDFAVRLEHVVARALAAGTGSDIADTRERLTRALYDDSLIELRKHLGRFLGRRDRVAVLIDNLDKAWDRSTDIDELASFLLGLVNAAAALAADFQRHDAWRSPVAFTVAIFIRSDIYAHVEERAREPDKLPTSRLLWDDQELLLRVVEERYEAARKRPGSGNEIWTRFFCPKVGDAPAREYLTWRILPRPRDLVFLCNAAITSAVNRGRDRIEEDDVHEAEKVYSTFALDALRVEAAAIFPAVDDVLLEFLQAPAQMDQDLAEAIVGRVENLELPASEAVEHLIRLSFLGWDIGDGRVAFATDSRDDAKSRRLASLAARNRNGRVRLVVHPAYRPYLEIADGLPA